MTKTLPICSRITCPHCWASLKPADLLWVSAHPDLRGDPYLGDDAHKRFLPSRFDSDGFALDENGVRCQLLACPQCHLLVPRILVELKPLFISIIGAPSSGKSYLLASSIWETRQRLRSFNLAFTDADPVANQIISEYEKKLFLSDAPDRCVAIPKTEEDGELYQRVDYGSRVELYARPFVFALRPGAQHAEGSHVASLRKVSRAVCLYDNAGEHFQPMRESELSLATDHLALSEAWIYVFDPLQHPKIRERCRAVSADPQLHQGCKTFRQDEVLLEAAKRVRQKANLPQHERLSRPLIVAVNKFDVWRHLLPELTLAPSAPYARMADGTVGVNKSHIDEISDKVKALLAELAPELLSACDAFSDDVTFVPVSPQGCSPEEVSGGQLGVRPGNLTPLWAEVPMLYAISRSRCPLVKRLVKTPPPYPGSIPPVDGRLTPCKVVQDD